MNEREWKTKIKLDVLSVFVATAGIICLPQILNLKENMLGFTNSIFSVFVWVLCLYAVNRSIHSIDIQDVRGWVIAGGLSFLFTLAMLFGVRIDSVGDVNFGDWKLWVSLPVLACFFSVLIRKLWNVLDNMEKTQGQFASYAKSINFNNTIQRLSEYAQKHQNILVFIFLILCWLPVLLAVYPGFFIYDAEDEYNQIAFGMYHANQPLVHVLLLGGIIHTVYQITDSYNLGIACYTIFQMILEAGCFTYLINFLRKRKVSKVLCFLALVYFAFFPVIIMFALCSSKDTIFTIAMLVLLICMLEMGISEESFFVSKHQMILFVLSVLIMSLFRKNGIYAFCLMVPVLLIAHKKYFKKMGLLLAIIFLSYFLISNGLESALHASRGGNQEILTVPIQQLARTYKFNKEVFTPEDIELLYEILPEEGLNAYRPDLSDHVKNYFNNSAFSNSKRKYIKLWARIGLRDPHSYVNAWLANSYGFWYPDTIVNVYRGHIMTTFKYQDSSYFQYEVEPPGERDSKIPWLDEVYRRLSIEIDKEKIPVVSMFYSLGCMFWCFAFMFSYVLYRRKYHILAPYLMVLCVWLTVIMGPTYLPRYVLIFWFGLPLFTAIMLEERKFECRKRET